MSKLIVEMVEMPQACPCEFADYSSHGIFRPCFAWNGIPARWHEVEKCAENGTRPDWCPIAGVLPEEHGDLIDRDVIHREIQLWKTTATDTITMCFLWHTEKMLMGIRPIIAAERKGAGAEM